MAPGNLPGATASSPATSPAAPRPPAGVRWRGDGYHFGMTTPHDDGPAGEKPDDDAATEAQDGGSTRDRETPEVGLIADEELPEDLQPTEDNPLAQDPDESDDATDAGPGAGPGGDEKSVEGMPDMGSPA